jgi:PAS domain S-box-containing protein
VSRNVNQLLAASEARYEAVFEHSPVPVCIYGLDTFRILDVNDAALRQYGYAKEELLGNDIRHLLHPDDIPRFERAPCRAKEGPQNGPVWRHVTKEGREILVRVSTHVIEFETQKAQMVVATDITEHRATRRRARNAERKLRNALTQTIQVLLSASEQRDAYTAGHQQRVGNLTTAIALEMQLAPTRIEGLRFGAMVHDIGKLGIPAEILSLPRKLKAEELALVRMHSQIGYDILKDMDYPWPIQDLVLQHHERLDGSGYPNRLRGQEICLEARVLAVADAVEAMASHRPYRAGIGVDRAVEEVWTERGTKYDTNVVAACIAVRDRGELDALLAR